MKNILIIIGERGDFIPKAKDHLTAHHSNVN